MTPVPCLLCLFAFVVAENNALEEVNTALVLKAAKDNPVLLKILQAVDTATSNERLYDVTLNLLKSLCVCMRETLRTKQLQSFQLSREMKSLQTDVANKKVLDIYQKIYNKTCFDLQEELALKVNKSRNLTPEEEKEFMEHSNCGKKAIDENTEDYERLTNQATQVVESEANMKNVLHTTFVITRDYHKFHMRKFNLFKKSDKSKQNSAKHSIIVILTLYPNQNRTQLSDNFTEINSAELNTTLYSRSPIDIDVIDTRYGRKENNRDEDFIPKPATHCSLKSIYSFLLQSEQVNKTKVFKILRKKGTIKVYIDIPTQINHIDYSKVCCSNETEIPLCKIDFSMESFDTHEITTCLPEFKKRKKLHESYKDTISKIKTLVKLYDRKLNRNSLNTFKSAEKNKGDKVTLSKVKSFKAPFRNYFNDWHAVVKSTTEKKYSTKQYVTEKYILTNITSSNESGMNTLLDNTDIVLPKELIRTTLRDGKNISVLQNEDSQVTNIKKIMNSTKPTASTEFLTKTTTPVESGLQENTGTKAIYGGDQKSSIIQSNQISHNPTVNDHLTTVYHSYSTETTFSPLQNNELITETETKFIQKTINTPAENLEKESSRSTTGDGLTDIFNYNSNINTNTIDYSDSAKTLNRTEMNQKQRVHNKNIEDPSVVSKNNYQLSTGVKTTQNSKGFLIPETDHFYVRSTNNENYEDTLETLNEKVVEMPTHMVTNENLPNLSTYEYLGMQQTQFKETGVMNKTLARSHIKNNNSLKNKEVIHTTTAYLNGSNLSNTSDMKTVTSTFRTFDNNITSQNLFTATVNHDDDEDDDLKPFIPSDQLNSQLTKLKDSKANETNMQQTKDQIFHNSMKTETPIIFFDSDIEEKSSFTKDQIKIKYNLEMTGQSYNVLDRFETTDATTKSTNKPFESYLSDTTEAVINFQLLQPELENTTMKNNDESDSFNATDIIGTSTKTTTVNNIDGRNNIKKNTKSVYFDKIYVTDGISVEKKTVQDMDFKVRVANILNITTENYSETNMLETFSQTNEYPNDIAHDFGDIRTDSIELFHAPTEGYTNTIDLKLKEAVRVTISSNLKVPEWMEINNSKLKDDALKLKESSKALFIPQVDENLKTTSELHKTAKEFSNVNDNSNKANIKMAESQNLYITESLKTTEKNIISNPSKQITTLNFTSGSNTKANNDIYEAVTTISSKAQEITDIKETLSIYFSSTEENLSSTTPLAATVLIDNSVEENTPQVESLEPTKDFETSYNTAHGIIWTEISDSLKDNTVKKDEFVKDESFKTDEMHSTNNMQTSFDIPIVKNIKSKQVKMKSNVDRMFMLGGLKSNKEFSNYSGDVGYNIPENNNKAIKTTGLLNSEQFLPSQTIIKQSREDKTATTISESNLQNIVKTGSSMVLRQHNKSMNLSKTIPNLNDITEIPTEIIVTNDTRKGQRELNVSISDIKQYSSKANKSRITRSTSAMKNPIATYNRTSTFSTTLPFSDSLAISFSTSSHQDLNKLKIIKTPQPPERSNNFGLLLERTQAQSGTTVDPSSEKIQTEVITIPKTEKYQSISENDKKITTFIISPSIIQDIDTKKSIAELNNLMNLKALNATSDERAEKNIFNFVKATMLSNQTYSNKPHDVVVKEPQPAKYIDTTEINYSKNYANGKEHTEIRDNIASRLTTNLPQSKTYDTKGVLSDRNVAFGFIKENIPVDDTVISRLDTTEKFSNSITKPEMSQETGKVQKAQLDKIAQAELSIEYSKKINKTKLTGSNNDFTSLSVNGREIENEKYIVEAHNVAVTTFQPYATEDISKSRNIKTKQDKSNNRLPHMYNSKFEIAKNNTDYYDIFTSKNVNVDELVKNKTHKDLFKSMIDFDGYETLKTTDSTKLKDNVDAKSNMLHDILKTVEYNFTKDRNELTTRSPFFFKFTDYPSFTQDDSDIISNIIKPSIILNRHTGKANKLGGTVTSPNSMEYYTQMQNENKTTLDDLATHIHDSFKIKKVKNNNENRTSADVTLYDMAEIEIPKDHLTDLLITNLNKVKMSNGLEPTEKLNINVIQKDIKNNLKITVNPSFNATTTNGDIKTELITLTGRPDSTADKVAQIDIFSNIFNIPNTTTQDTIKTNNFAVTEFSLNVTANDTAKLNKNTAPINLVSHVEESFRINKENTGINNNVTSSYTTDNYFNRDKINESASNELFNTDTNKTYALNEFLLTEVFKNRGANPDVVNDKVEITKQASYYATLKDKITKTKQYSSLENGTDFETLTRTPNYFQVTNNTLNYTDANFENNMISSIEKSSNILYQQQADAIDDLALTKPLPNSRGLYVGTQSTNSTPSKDRVKRKNETFRIKKETTEVYNIPTASEATVGYLSDNELHETSSTELLITNTDKPKTLSITKLDTKSSGFDHFLELTEAPSYDATLRGETLRTGYHNLFRNEKEFTKSDKSQLAQTTDSSRYTKNRDGDNSIIYNYEETFFPNQQYEAVTHNVTVAKPNSSEYQNETQDQVAYMAELRKTKEIEPSNKIISSNDVTGGNLSGNVIQKYISKSDLNTDAFGNQPQSEPTREISIFDTRLNMIDKPLRITKESNFDETQTEAIIKSLISQENKTLGYFTEITTPTESFKVVKNTQIQDNRYSSKTKSKEETSKSVLFTSREDQNKDTTKTYNSTEIKNASETFSIESDTQFDENLTKLKQTIEINNITTSNNETLMDNDRTENKIHEVLSNTLVITDSDETTTHKALEPTVVANHFDYKITAEPSFDKIQAISVLANLRPEKYNSFQLVTESTRQTKKSKYLKNTSFTGRALRFSNEEIITLRETEPVKITTDTAKTTRFLNPKYSDKVSQAVTESLPDYFIWYDVSTDTIPHLNNEFIFKKEATESNKIVAPSDILVHNLSENEIHNTLSKASHKTEFGGSETLKDLKLGSLHDNLNNRFHITDQHAMVTEKSSLYNTQKVETTKSFPSDINHSFKYSPEFTTFDIADRRIDLQITKMGKTNSSQSNRTELNDEKSSNSFNHTQNHSYSAEYNTDAHKTSFKLSKARNKHLNNGYHNTKNDTENNAILALTERNETPKVPDITSNFHSGSSIIDEQFKLTVEPILNETEVVDIHNPGKYYSLQNKTEFATPKEIQNSALISENHVSINDDIVNGFNIVGESVTSYYNDRTKKQKNTLSNDVDPRVDSKNKNIELITDTLAIIESATASYNHFMDDLTFLDTAKILEVADGRLARENQTGLGGQFTTTGDKNYEYTKTGEKMDTTVLTLQSKVLESPSTKIKDNLEILTQFNTSKKPKEKENSNTHFNFQSSTGTDPQRITARDDSNFTERHIVKPKFNESRNIISTIRVNTPMKMNQYESLGMLLTITSNSTRISKTSSDYPNKLHNSYSETTTDNKIANKVNQIEETSVTSHNTASNARLNADFQLMNESTINIEKKTTTMNGLEIFTKPEKKMNIDENFITATTKKVISEANMTATVNELRIIELLNKIRNSYVNNMEWNDMNDLRKIRENYYSTGTTQLIETNSYLSDTKVIHEIDSRNIFDGNEIVRTTLHKHNPVTVIYPTTQLQSKTAYVNKATRYNEINLEEKGIANDTEINTTESHTQYLTPIPLTDSGGKRFRGNHLTDVQDQTHPISFNMYTSDHFNKFEEMIEPKWFLKPNTQYSTPSINAYFTFDQARTEANSNYENKEISNNIFEIFQDSFGSKTNMFNSLQNKPVSLNTYSASHFSQKRNKSKTTELSKKITEQGVTQLISTYTEYSSEGQLRSSENMNEFNTEVESNSITLAPKTTPTKFSLDEIFNKGNAKITTQTEGIEKYFVRSPTIIPSVEGNLTITSPTDTLEGTEGTLSMTDENIITKRSAPINYDGTKPNTVDELTLPVGKNSIMDGGTILLNVPPLAFHVTDLKFELVPTYNNYNKSQIITKLHGKFNISLNMNSQHVTDSMDHNKTHEVFNRAKAIEDQLHPPVLGVNSTFRSIAFEKPESESKKYKETAHDKMTDFYLPSLVKNETQFFSNSNSSTSESEKIKYFSLKDDTLSDLRTNKSIKTRDKGNELITTIEKYTNLDQYTVTDVEQRESTTLLLQLNTNLNSYLRSSSPSPDSLTTPYTFNTNLNTTNLLNDIHKVHNTTLSNSSNQEHNNYYDTYSGNMEIGNINKTLKYDKMNNINLTRSTKILTVFETELNNVTQASKSRRYGDKTKNIFPKDVIETTDYKFLRNNTSDNFGMTDSIINITKLESDQNITNLNTTMRSLYTGNTFLNMTRVIDDNNLSSSSYLVPITSEHLHNVNTVIILQKGNLPESATSNRNKTLFVYAYNKTNVQNPEDLEKSPMETTTVVSQITESRPYALTPIVTNIVLTEQKINNSKYKNFKNVLKETNTGKTKEVKLKSKVGKSPSTINKTKSLPSFRKANAAPTLSELSIQRYTDPGITVQKTDTLTTVHLNVLHTPRSQNGRIKDKKKHLTELRKQQNRKPTLLESVNVKKGSNAGNIVTITGKTEHNSDSKVKYEAFSSTQKVHVASKPLLRTTKQIKYNTYRPLTEEELHPPELEKIISFFPKYYTKKVKTKNPQQVKNYHDAPYGNQRKNNTKQDLHNKSHIFDPLDKKNLYPVKKVISNPRKVIKRLKLANKRNDIMTMNTEDFFSRRLKVTKKDKIGDILKLYPKPVLKLRPVTSIPRSVVLRPKFNSFNTLTNKPAIKKPVIIQNMDVDYYRGLNLPHYRRSGPIWKNVINQLPRKPEVPSRTGFAEPVIDTPYYIPTIVKPKFLRDRVDSIRSYIYNAEKQSNYRRHFLNRPVDADYPDDSQVQYSKGNSRDEEDTDKPVHRITRPKKTIFFLSPTVPYNRYF